MNTQGSGQSTSVVRDVCVVAVVIGAIICGRTANGQYQEAASIPPAHEKSAAPGKTGAAYGQLPLAFEINEGQSDPGVKFLCRGAGYGLFLTGCDTVLALTRTEHKEKPTAKSQKEVTGVNAKPVASDMLRIKLLGAKAQPQVEGLEPLPGKSNYIIGNDPKKWRTNVPQYARVKSGQVYPGIDLVYYGRQRQLEYDFQVAPGADPGAIHFTVEGASKVSLNADGDLVLQTPGGDVIEQAPILYQEVDGKRKTIGGGYEVQRLARAGSKREQGCEVSFRVATYDRARPLVIDPVLAYSTYLGGNGAFGSGGDEGQGIAADGSGNAYVTGFTTSSNYPTTTGAFQTSNTGLIVFVTKLNAAGSALVYSTYLGGTQNGFGIGGGDDYGQAIAVDKSGNAYITGQTFSTNFPTTPGAFQTGLASGASYTAFVTKLNASGSALVYSTYLGDSNESDGNDVWGRGIAVDGLGNAYVAGSTSSTYFPTTPGAFQTTDSNGVSNTGFVTKLNPTGSALVYSTYLGGSGGDGASAIAVDSVGNAFVTGQTYSTDFPVTKGAYQTTLNAHGGANAFITKLNATGSALVYSTYLGGNDLDGANGIAVDGAGNTYIAGETNSSNFPTTTGAFQPAFHADRSGGSAFVTKLNATGSALIYSTFLGSFGSANGIVVNGSSNAWVAGETDATNFPTTPGAFQTELSGTWTYSVNTFVTELNTTGTGLVYSTYVGGGGAHNSFGDVCNAIAMDGSGNAYITGYSYSPDFPITAGAFQTTLAGTQNAFVARLSASSEMAPQTYTVTPISGSNGRINPNSPGTVNSGTNVSFLATPGSGYVVNQWLVNGNPVQTSGSTYLLMNVGASDTVEATFIGVSPSLEVDGPSSVTIAAGESATFSVTIAGPPDSYAFQWQVSTDGGATWTPLSNNTTYGGVTSPTLTVANATAAMSGYEYGCVVTNSLGSTTSNPATLTRLPFIIYVASSSGSEVYRITPTGVVSKFAGGFSGISAMTTDTSGNLYVANGGNNTISKVTPAGTVSTLATGVASQAGLACDGSGNIYVANVPGEGNNTVLKVTPSGVVSTFASGFNDLGGIACDATGSVYVADYTASGKSIVSKITPTGEVDLFASGVYNAEGLAFDRSGNLYSGNVIGSVTKITPAGVVTTFAGGVGWPQDLVSDGSGNLFVTNGPGFPISEVTPDGAVNNFAGVPDATAIAIATAPASPTTSSHTVAVSASPSAGGTISGGGTFASGSPNIQRVAASPNGGYAFVNWTENGNVVSSSARYYFQVNSSRNLVAHFAAITYKTLDHSLAVYGTYATGVSGSNVVGYYLDANNAAHGFLYNGVTYTPLDDPSGGANGGGTYPQGISSDSTIVGYYSDGQAHGFIYDTSGYRTIQDPKDNGNTWVAGISGSNIVGYTGNVQGFVLSGTTYTILNGPENVAAYSLSGISGSNIVGSYSGGAFLYNGSTYTELFNPLSNASLHAQGVSGDTVVGFYYYGSRGASYRGFLYFGGAYTNLDAPGGVGTTRALGISGNTVVGNYLDSNRVSHGYIATISGSSAPSKNANLSALSLSAGILAPPFASGTLNYSATVSNPDSSITVMPTLADLTAMVTADGTNVTSGNASGPINLSVGTNNINVVVTAEDGATTNTYTVVVTRAFSSDASLSGLILSSGTVTPSFAANILIYTANVSNSTSSITVMPTVADSTARVTVDGNPVASGAASGPISLNVGDNAVAVVVTAQDGVTTTPYRVTVHRNSTDATLSTLSLSGIILNSSFSSGTMAYTASVPYTTKSTTVSATADNAGAVVSGNIGVQALSVGSNVLNILVSAENGNTLTYTVTVIRTPPVPAVPGTYEGLLVDESGYITISLSANGKFTGKAIIAGVSHSLAGQIDSAGSWKGALSGVTGSISLQLGGGQGGSPGSSFITGFVNGTALTAYNAAYGGGQTVLEAGKYTILFFATGTSVGVPSGTGYATLTVSKTGSLIMAGKLGDGTASSASGVIVGSPNGNQVVIYDTLSYPSVSTQREKGFLVGYLTFVKEIGTSDLNGALIWNKPAQSRGAWPAHMDTTLNVIGSFYQPAAAGERVLEYPNVEGNGKFIAQDGGSAESGTDIVTLSAANTIAPLPGGTDKLGLKVNPLNGTVTGSFVPPGGSAPASLNGVIFQIQNLASGFFLSGSEGGTFNMEANPEFGPATLSGSLAGPVVTITSPAANAKISGTDRITFTGKASDAKGVAAVYYQILYSGSIGLPQAASGTTNWSFAISPAPNAGGVYTVYVQAVDGKGNSSAPLGRTCTYVVPSASVVTVNGEETVGSGDTGRDGLAKPLPGKNIAESIPHSP